MTIQFRSSGTQSVTSDKIQPGTSVTLQAVPAEGYKFKRWVVVNSDFVIPNATSAETTFTMPNLNLKIRADFEADVQPAPTMYSIDSGVALVAPASLAAGDDLTVGCKIYLNQLGSWSGFPTLERVTGFSVYDESEHLISGPHALGATISMPASNVVLYPEVSEAVVPQIIIVDDSTPSQPMSVQGIVLSDPVPLASSGTFTITIPSSAGTITGVSVTGFANATWDNNVITVTWSSDIDIRQLVGSEVKITMHPNT